MTLWAAQWRSNCRMAGERRHIIFNNGFPVLFRSRKDAREWINATHGYIRNRPDLRREPHGWRMPVPVRVEVHEVQG